jgi:hypothetical protein
MRQFWHAVRWKFDNSGHCVHQPAEGDGVSKERRYAAVSPPSSTSTWPVTDAAAGLAK